MPRPPSRPDDRCLPGMEQQPGAGGGRDRRRDHRGAAGHRPGDRARSDGRCRRRVAGAFGYDIEARWRTPMVCDGSPGPPGQAQRAVVSLWSAARAMPGMKQQAYPISDYQTTYGHEDRIQVLAPHRTRAVPCKSGVTPGTKFAAANFCAASSGSARICSVPRRHERARRVAAIASAR